MILSRQTIKRAKELREKNPHKWSWKSLGRLFDCHPNTIRRAIDPDYHHQKSTYDRKRRLYGMSMTSRPISDDELKERKSLIPDTHPDNTGRLMGDPIPNDRRRAA
jgi:hypothetical protein